ncbi:MAG: DUF2911 domain-containing protein [Pedobacter sp.]|nr:MAG: DUF2911 domain-containing protein [Pedobacter sp.]
MKVFALITAFVGLSLVAQAQTPTTYKFPGLDASPLDVAYFPVNAARVKKEDKSQPVIKVLYSRPSAKGREIFGVLEKYDQVWRLGANESTEITFNKPVEIGQKKVKAGQYSLFAIPQKDKWTIILNSQLNRWGAFSYDESMDVLRFDVPITTLDKTVEAFSIVFAETSYGAEMVMAWDKTQAILPIHFTK